jgi:hypothetical protein
MKPWEYFLLFLLGLAVTLIVAGAQNSPGYMDADYYCAGGIQLVSGKGLTEPFLWNYLDDPAGLPHPSFSYWMPLASLLAAAGMALTGETDFFSARLAFLLLAGFVPVVTAWVAYRLTHRRVTAWTAGGLAICSGFYAVYLGLTETLTLYMLLGTAFLSVAAYTRPGMRKAALLGLLAGLMHLARADGILWVGVGLFLLGWEAWKFRSQRGRLAIAGSFMALILAYALVMGFWFGRNLVVFGSLVPIGTSRALWISSYDQLFAFPASTLSPQNWLSVGLLPLLLQRWDALLANLQTALAVQGAVFLTPLILIGLWRLRKAAILQIGMPVWLLTFLIMTLVFPLAGARGGFLHSGAAFQPLLWAAAAEGLLAFIEWGVRWRNWKVARALPGFGIIAVLIAALLTAGVTAPRVLASDDPQSGWSASWQHYTAVDAALDGLAVSTDQVVMVNNPPGFFIASGRPAIVIPNGGIDTLLAAAQKYHGAYLVLEENSVAGLIPLYKQPKDVPGLKYITAVGSTYLFLISPAH